MNKEIFLESVKKLREISPKRKFNQSIDIIINLKDIDLKKPNHKVDAFITLPFSRGKEVRVCALVDNELSSQSKNIFTRIITRDEFENYKNKKIIKKLADEFDYFIAQANLMNQIATKFGKVLGPRGKMPNPKAGCVILETTQLQNLNERLQRTIRFQTKNEPALKASIGIESMNDIEIAENAYYSFNSIVHLLPQEKNSIRNIILKTSMGPPVFVTEKGIFVKQYQEATTKIK